MHFSEVRIQRCAGGAGEVVVPREFLTYQASKCMEGLLINGVQYLKFGVFGQAGSALLHEDGTIWGQYPGGPVFFVNSSMDKFSECVKRVLEMYPFYPDDSEFEDWEAGAQRVEQLVKEVDLQAYAEGSFWNDFRWDVTTGDYGE